MTVNYRGIFITLAPGPNRVKLFGVNLIKFQVMLRKNLRKIQSFIAQARAGFD
jgi:hypothetical protein